MLGREMRELERMVSRNPWLMAECDGRVSMRRHRHLMGDQQIRSVPKFPRYRLKRHPLWAHPAVPPPRPVSGCPISADSCPDRLVDPDGHFAAGRFAYCSVQPLDVLLAPFASRRWRSNNERYGRLVSCSLAKAGVCPSGKIRPSRPTASVWLDQLLLPHRAFLSDGPINPKG